jgi:hypothetical protein
MFQSKKVLCQLLLVFQLGTLHLYAAPATSGELDQHVVRPSPPHPSGFSAQITEAKKGNKYYSVTTHTGHTRTPTYEETQDEFINLHRHMPEPAEDIAQHVSHIFKSGQYAKFDEAQRSEFHRQMDNDMYGRNAFNRLTQKNQVINVHHKEPKLYHPATMTGKEALDRLKRSDNVHRMDYQEPEPPTPTKHASHQPGKLRLDHNSHPNQQAH